MRGGGGGHGHGIDGGGCESVESGVVVGDTIAGCFFCDDKLATLYSCSFWEVNGAVLIEKACLLYVW